MIIDHLRSNVPVTAPKADIVTAARALVNVVPEEGWSTNTVLAHLLQDIASGLARGASGPRFFGFVTGGALPAAQCADILTTIFDQNVQVHLPDETICTALEHKTLLLILDLFNIPRETFAVGSLTTGATGSNVLGLACGRDAAIQHALSNSSYSTGDDGIPPNITIRVLTDRHHASIEKAAALVGIGRRNVKSLEHTIRPFVQALEDELKASTVQGKKVATIVVVSFAEVNTGDFTDLTGVRDVCDRYGVWLHVDAAFGAMACLLPEYAHISEWMAQADSLTSDGHKWFNVPYACGIFYCRSRQLLTSILAGSGAVPAYLSTSHSSNENLDLEWTTTVPSPLHTNIENSRRFIALPLYAALLAMGRQGYVDIVRRNVQFARNLSEWMCSEENGGGKWFEVLNLRDVKVSEGTSSKEEQGEKKMVPLNVVLFRPKDTDDVPTAYRRSTHRGNKGTATLIRDVNATKKLYVSPGAYSADDGGAVRIAVSNWMTGYMDDGADLEAVKDVLRGLMRVDS